MGRPWFVDAIDPKSGYAFASLREPNLLDAERLKDVPSIFVSPPFFRAEPVAHPGIAAAAARMRSQEGLFGDKGEVPFDSPDSFAEFVRRLYLSSGGRGDAGPEGPGTEGPPPGDLPPQTSEPKAWLIEALDRQLQKFEDESRRLSDGGATAFYWTLEGSGNGANVEMVLRSTLRTILEVGVPLNRPVPPSDEPWLRAWCHCAWALDVVPHELAHRHEVDYFRYYAWQPGFHRFDPIDCMQRLAIPGHLAKHLELGPANGDVWSATMRLIGTPALLGKPGSGLWNELVSLLILASALVTSGALSMLTSDPRQSWYEQRMRLALDWLSQQLPKYAFAARVEALIRGR